MQSFFCLEKSESGLVMASKRREDKGSWEKLKGKKSKQLNQVTFARLSLYTQHVAYSSRVKSQDNPSLSIHCYLSLHIVAFIQKETAMILLRVTFESYWVRKSSKLKSLYKVISLINMTHTHTHTQFETYE